MTRTPKVCPGCGRPTDPLTRTRNGYCSPECSATAAITAAAQMRQKSGPYYDRWRQRMTEIHGKPPRGRG